MARSKKPKTITKKQFDRWSAEKQQRALNDTRTRIRIADNALPAEWLERRKKARWNRTPITQGTATTYGDLEKQRAYLEPLTFGEGDRQLSDRTANLAAARQRDADWFTQYRADVAAAQQRAIGAQTQMAEGNRALIDSANQVSVSGRDAVVRQLQDRAAQLGQAPQGGQYQAIADQAASARAASLANTAQRQVSDANARVGLATDAVGTAALKDREAQGYRDRQASALDQDRKDYGSKKDAWRAKFIDDAISEARKQVLEDRVFQLNAADKAADNKLAADRLALDKKKARQDAAAKRRTEARLQAEADRKAADGGNTQPGSGRDRRTTVQNRAAKSKIARALSFAAELRAGGYTQSQIRASLTQGKTIPKYIDGKGNTIPAKKLPAFDKDVVNTALDISYRGFVGPANYRIWARGGYSPASWGWKIKKKGR